MSLRFRLATPAFVAPTRLQSRSDTAIVVWVCPIEGPET
jgi:hypothetical protein